jgi:uncharacterized protein (TIGR03382 family)
VSCSSHAECLQGAYCHPTSHACVPVKSDGSPCQEQTECMSGFCADGVCCNAECAGLCEACTAALSGFAANGICAPIAAGTDPQNECATLAPGTCSTDGQCNGARACRFYPVGTACGDGSCEDATGAHSKHTAVQCDGLGACVPALSTDCGLFRCNGALCRTTCNAADQCLASAWCDNGLCRSKNKDGAACAADAECENLHCVDGYCCDGACDGACEACDVENKQGVCTTLAKGVAPHGQRPPCDPGEGPCAPACDGLHAKSCTAAGFSQSCGTATCTNEVEREPRCDGEGYCKEAQTKECVNFACGTERCKISCAANTDCAPLFKCDTASGDCLPVGARCDGDHQLVENGKVAKDCAPFRCTNGDVCIVLCTSRADCVEGMSCTPEGMCELEPAQPDVSDAGEGCSCSNVQLSHGSPGTWAGLLLLPLLLLRRRRALTG